MYVSSTCRSVGNFFEAFREVCEYIGNYVIGWNYVGVFVELRWLCVGRTMQRSIGAIWRSVWNSVNVFLDLLRRV